MSEIHTMIDHKDEPDDLKPQSEGGAIDGLKAMEPDISGFVYRLTLDGSSRGIFCNILQIENFILNDFVYDHNLSVDRYLFDAYKHELNKFATPNISWSAKLCRSEDNDPHEWQLTVENRETGASSVHFLEGGSK